MTRGNQGETTATKTSKKRKETNKKKAPEEDKPAMDQSKSKDSGSIKEKTKKAGSKVKSTTK